MHKTINFPKRHDLTNKANQIKEKSKYQSLWRTYGKLCTEIMKSKTIDEAMIRAEAIISGHCDSADPDDWWIKPNEIEELIGALRRKDYRAAEFKEIYNIRDYNLLCKREEENQRDN